MNGSSVFNRSEYGDRKLGQILLDRRLISVSQLSDALIAQQKFNDESNRCFKIGEILLFAEVIKIDDLQSALRSQKFRAQAHRADAVASKSQESIRNIQEGKLKKIQDDFKAKKRRKKKQSFFSKLLSGLKGSRS